MKNIFAINKYFEQKVLKAEIIEIIIKNLSFINVI